LNGDFQALKKGAHGRVDVLVGAGHPMPLLLQDAGQGGHAGAADAEKVDVGCRIYGHFGNDEFRSVGWALPTNSYFLILGTIIVN
jgi:hypothetical protein